METPEKPSQKEKADNTTKERCFEPHYELCKHPSCPYKKPPMGVGFEAVQRMKAYHRKNLEEKENFQ